MGWRRAQLAPPSPVFRHTGCFSAVLHPTSTAAARPVHPGNLASRAARWILVPCITAAPHFCGCSGAITVAPRPSTPPHLRASWSRRMLRIQAAPRPARHGGARSVHDWDVASRAPRPRRAACTSAAPRRVHHGGATTEHRGWHDISRPTPSPCLIGNAAPALQMTPPRGIQASRQCHKARARVGDAATRQRCPASRQRRISCVRRRRIPRVRRHCTACVRRPPALRLVRPSSPSAATPTSGGAVSLHTEGAASLALRRRHIPGSPAARRPLHTGGAASHASPASRAPCSPCSSCIRASRRSAASLHHNAPAHNHITAANHLAPCDGAAWRHAYVSRRRRF